jgi:hypothetical protein
MVLRLLKFGFVAIVVGGGTALALVELLTRDYGGAAVMAGIVITAALAARFLGDEAPRKKSRGFEPGRRS